MLSVFQHVPDCWEDLADDDDFEDEMLTMRCSDLRATGNGISVALHSEGPSSSVDDIRGHESGYTAGQSDEVPSEHACGPEGTGTQVLPPAGILSDETLRQPTSFPTTVRPNVKQLNMPWETQPVFFELGSGKAPQGVSLAPRDFGNGLSTPGSHFANPTTRPYNAEFPELGRSLEIPNWNSRVSCSPEDGLNSPIFGGSSEHTKLHESSRAIVLRIILFGCYLFPPPFQSI